MTGGIANRLGGWEVLGAWLIFGVTFMYWFITEPNFISVEPAELLVDGYVPSLDYGVPVEFAPTRYLAVTGNLVGGPRPGRRSEIAVGGKNWEAISEAKRRFPLGTKVPVYVDARHPDVAYLSRAKLWPYVIAMFGLPIGALVTFGVLAERRRETRQPDA